MRKALLFIAAAFIGMSVNAQVIFSEDFQSTDAGSMPTGWVTYSDDLVNSSNYANFNDSWQVAQVSEGDMAAVSISWTEPQGNDCDRWMVTPAITIPNGSGYYLTFNTFGRDGNFPEKVKVMVSTTGQDKADFTTTLLDETLGTGEFDYSASLDAYAGQTIYLAFVNHGDGYYLIVDDIMVQQLPASSIALTSVRTGMFYSMEDQVSVDVTVKNLGQSLTSFDYAYSINGENETTGTISGINLPYAGTYTFNIRFGISTPGTVAVNVAVSNPNGVDDVDESDNSGSAVTTVYDPAFTAPRHSVYEHFTTARCPNCPSGHQRIAQAITGLTDRMSWIAHHCGYYTDDMTIAASEALMEFYNDGGSTYAPASMIDRNYDVAQMVEPNPGPIFFPDESGLIRNQMEAALAYPSVVSCNINSLNYNTSNRNLSFTVSGSFTQDLAFDSPRLTVYLVEDSIVGTQSGANGRYVHDHVVRAALTDAWGDADAFTTTNSGDSYSKTFNFTVPSTCRANKCHVVAFVSNYDASNVNNRAIMNGAESELLTNVAIDDVQPAVRINTYPNPANQFAYINAGSMIRSIEVVNSLGQKVFTEENVNANVFELNVSNMTSGVYFVTVVTDKGIATERLSVVK